MHLSEADNLHSLCFSILRGIVSTLNEQEISSIRMVSQPHTKKFPSIIVRLTTSARAQQILLTRKERNYYSTQDIDRSVLKDDLTSRIPPTKILINDVLSSSEYKKYQTLKPIAKNLGFAFVWHSGGKFLVRWNNNQRAFTFNSITDLNTIRDIYICTNTLRQQNMLTLSSTQTNQDSKSKNTELHNNNHK